MGILDHTDSTTTFRTNISKQLMIIGGCFAVIGAVAVLLPAWATLAGELMIAWMLALWGAVGLWFAWGMRAATEWRYAAGAFGITFLLGVVFILFPFAGIETMTAIIIMVFLVEGIVSILLGLRMSGRLRKWGWMIFSGVCSLIVGIIVLVGWPQTADWALGLLLGLNFLSSGLSLVMLGKAVVVPLIST